MCGHHNSAIVPGAIFGRLTVIQKLPRNLKKNGKGFEYRTLCECTCGNQCAPPTSDISAGRVTSCGCRKKETGSENAKKRIKPGIGYGTIVPNARFQRLMVIERRGYKVLVRCDCGIEKETTIDGLVGGTVTSCGCLKKEKTIERNKKTAKYAGFSTRYPKSWLRWSSMIARCTKPKTRGYAEYGGRGVKICAWLMEHPANLRKLLGPWRKAKPSLDRFPIHDGHYSCGRCEECEKMGWMLNIRWATRKEQSLNRGDFNVWITAFGMTLTKSQWSELSGLTWGCITNRLRRDWSPERALSTPNKTGNCYRPISS